MDIGFPFVRCFPKDNQCADGTARSVYYLLNSAGDIEEVASSLLLDENTVVYEACADFREKYGHIFPIGSTNTWNSKKAMLKWANKMIWFSFLMKGHVGLPKTFPQIAGVIIRSSSVLFLPDWDERFGNSSTSSLWILLRNGKKIWPVHVVHNQFGDGWADFWESHKLRRGFKLVFGCERTWIFDVVVLTTNLEPLHCRWSTTAHEFQESSLMPSVIDDLGTPGHLRTSCLPSMMSTNDKTMQFGFDCGPGKCIFRVFQKRLRDYSRDYFRDAGDHDIFLRMRNGWWGIPIINNRVDRSGLARFFEALNLQPLDFLLVTAFDGADVNVMVFREDGIERVYPWT
ncbi:hypothetical protein RHSIM_Rhsim02G0185700 [Rhododendron simsii]|uniref:Uncharacterized protein n=1 Tax=Rhododendron simsii TaxID=118357 RepID=A0A834HCI3_RHOSS|nr:hypothetical protein RHSIM_Rhsim02G0185700 [Rhododendron simsii]